MIGDDSQDDHAVRRYLNWNNESILGAIIQIYSWDIAPSYSFEFIIQLPLICAVLLGVPLQYLWDRARGLQMALFLVNPDMVFPSFVIPIWGMPERL